MCEISDLAVCCCDLRELRSTLSVTFSLEDGLLSPFAFAVKRCART